MAVVNLKNRLVASDLQVSIESPPRQIYSVSPLASTGELDDGSRLWLIFSATILGQGFRAGCTLAPRQLP